MPLRVSSTPNPVVATDSNVTDLLTHARAELLLAERGEGHVDIAIGEGIPGPITREIQAAFDDLFDDVYAEVDVYVQAPSPIDDITTVQPGQGPLRHQVRGSVHEQRRERHTSADEHGRAPHNLRVAVNDRVALFHLARPLVAVSVKVSLAALAEGHGGQKGGQRLGSELSPSSR